MKRGSPVKNWPCLLVLFILLSFIWSRAEGDDSEEKDIYQKMSGILLSYEPGICYTSLHEYFRKMSTAKPLRLGYECRIKPLARISRGVERERQISKILVVANANLYADLKAREKIDRYVRDIHRGYSCEVILVTVDGGEPEDLKELIKEYYDSGLDGAVFVGSLPAAWYEVPNDHYWWEGGRGYANWTCDLFFMDLDGQWDDTDSNGIYDLHTEGSGDVEPEVFVGRIDTSTMSYYGSEVDLLCSYLDKNHSYWCGDIVLNRYGLAYIDYDWRNEHTNYFSYLFGPGNYDSLKWQSENNLVTKHDYSDNRLLNPLYEFIQVWTHATYLYHDFHTGGSLYHYEVHAKNPRALGYNIDGCHACDWAAGGWERFLGGSYVYNDSPSSLVVIGSTKVGGMLGFDAFYESLGKNRCLGEAFSDWFKDRLNSGQEKGYIIGWHYGMTIIGDPLIAFLEVPGLDSSASVVYPPLNFFGRREENRALFLKEYINVLTWEANPQNTENQVSSYHIYEISNIDRVFLAEVGGQVSEYMHRGVEKKEYLYGITAVDAEGQESYTVYTKVR